MATDYEVFQQQLENDLKLRLSENYGHVTINRTHVDKLQGESYDAFRIAREGSEIGVSLDVSALFARFSNGEHFTNLIDSAEESIQSGFRNSPQFDIYILQDYDAMKDHLSVELVNTKTNQELLANIPHKEIEDLSVVYRVILNNTQDGRATVLVNNDMIANLGISPSQLHADAILSSEKNQPVSLRSMTEVISEMIGGEFPIPPAGDSELYVATNTERLMGAGIILYPSFLQDAAQQLDGNFFVLPSSIHEVLLIPESSGRDYRELEDMVRMVNASEVAQEDRLSDNVYHYDSQADLFELAADYEARIMLQENLQYDGVPTAEGPPTMTVLLVEPNKYPQVIEMDSGLESLQRAVGGYIEAIYPFEDQAAIICNEEGKLNGLPLNRALRDEDGEVYDVLAGSFLVTGLTEDNFGSLTPEQLSKYEEVFHQPEAFVKMGRSVMAFPIPDEAVEKMAHPKPIGKGHEQPSL